MNLLIFSLNLYLIISYSTCVSSDKREQAKFVMILIDGFRHDYVKSIPNLSGFKELIANGVTTEYVTPIFPSTSYPNYYSIATGLFAESHGFVGNFMYDQPTNTSFLVGSNPESDNEYWWNGAEPLWITAEKQKIKTAIYYWSGCHIKIRETKPYYCQPYNKKPPNNIEIEAAFDDTIAKFKTNEIQMSFIYYELVDKMGHYYGPFSAELNRTVEELDKLLIKFRIKLKEKSLEDNVNIVLVSDHGMTSISQEKHVKLYEYADIKSNSYAAFPEIAILPIYPKKDQADKLFNDLSKIKEHAKVYQKKDFPEEWHFKNNKRTPDLLVTADEGYFLLMDEQGWDHFLFIDQSTRKRRLWGGMHGYNNKLPSMRSFFAAIGPDFKHGYLNQPILEVDIYNVMCKISNVKPEPNNGTWDNVKDMLNIAYTNSCNIMLILLLSIIMTILQLKSPIYQLY